MVTPNAHPASQQGADPNGFTLRAMRTGFRLLHRVSPRKAVELASGLFLRPRRHRPPQWEWELRERAELRRVTVRPDRDVALWTIGEGPRVLLTHGWEGRGSQLGRMVDPLLGAGRSVAFFDHLGHGESDGKRSSLLHMRDGLEVVARELGPIDAFVAHSMGSIAGALALHEGILDARRVVFFAPPFDFQRYLVRYVNLVTGLPGLEDDILQRLEQTFGRRWEDVELPRVAPGMRRPLLVLHGEEDLDVPLQDGRRVAEVWPGARFEALSGVGHRRVLRDTRAAEHMLSFLTG